MIADQDSLFLRHKNDLRDALAVFRVTPSDQLTPDLPKFWGDVWTVVTDMTK